MTQSLSILPPRPPRRRLTRNRWPIGVAFCLPLVVGLLCFTVFPVLASAYFSLCDYPIFDAPEWRGVGNYGELVQDPRVWLSLWNTAYFAIFAVPLGMFCGLMLALLLNLRIRGMAFYRTMFFLPSIMPLVATCVLWNKVLHPDFGLVNTALRWLHISENWVPGWLTSEVWAKPGLVLMSAWGCGGGMVLYLAALQDVPQELYESAAIDGANPWHRFRHITLPMISPVLLFNLIMGLIGAVQSFMQAYVMTAGGPRDSTLFYALYLFDNAFTEFRLGYASAMAWVMFALVLVLSFGLMKLANRYVYYHS